MTSQQQKDEIFGSQKTEGENLYDNLNSPIFDEPMGGEQSPIVQQDLTEGEQHIEEWKEELVKIESEIVTLKQVLGAKVQYAADLKRKMGITPFQELQKDLSEGIKSIKESDTYQKTTSVVKTASEKTTAAMSAVGGAMSRKMGDIRNSQTFKSVEEKVEHAYANVKAKVTGSKSEGNFEDALRAETEADSPDSTSPRESPLLPLPEEKVPL